MFNIIPKMIARLSTLAFGHVFPMVKWVFNISNTQFNITVQVAPGTFILKL